MKDILIDIKDLTDSREMYQTKPHPFVWIFTYILIAIIIAAVIWAYFGKKEIVVTANGQVRPESGISTVKNIVSGEVENVNYKQGMAVKAGDILYTIKHDNLLVEKEAQSKQLSEQKKELKNLELYRKSVLSGINEFDQKTEPMYYEKVRKLLMDIKYTQTDTDYRVSKLNAEKNVNSAQLNKYQAEMTCLDNYVKSLDSKKSCFGSNSEIERQYGQKYDNFLISQRELERKYDQQSNEIRSNSFEALKQNLEDQKALVAAYKTLKKSVEEEKNYFSEGDRYASLYNDYEFKLSTLKNAYEEQKRIYDAYSALSGVAITKSELESARSGMKKAEGEYTSYKPGFLADLNKKLSDGQISVMELESRISGTFDNQTLLKLNDSDRENALKKLYLDERQAAVDSINKLNDTMNSLRLNIILAKAELRTVSDAGGENNNISYSLVDRTKAQEAVATDEKIKGATDNVTALEQNIKKLQLDIDNAIVKASVDGVVNVLTEVFKGDFIASGNDILTIIPDKNSAFTMQILVNNKDIGELHIGDTVKYSFAALPYREYGQVTGKITNISKDALTNQQNGQSFYTVEATVPDGKLVSNSGKQGEIKVGMLCDANIITKQKSYLRYFLEKVNLLD